MTCLLLVVTGCSSLQGTGSKGYISGNGQYTRLAVGDRGEPVEVAGTTLDDDPLSLADLRGSVVVVNIWASWCADCVAEMPDLVSAAQDLGADAEFVGINVRDLSPDNARSFERSFDVPYPSLYDPQGETLLAFRGVVSPRAIPSTLVLDRQGRIAVSIIGPLPSALTLIGLVEDVAAEGSSGGDTDG